MVTIQMLRSFEFGIRIRVPKIDECETNTLSLSVVVDSSTYRTSLFDGVPSNFVYPMWYSSSVQLFRSFSGVKKFGGTALTYKMLFIWVSKVFF